MKKIIFYTIAIFSLLFSDIALSQDTSKSQLPDLIPYRKGDKWGFVDKDGKEVTPFKYDKVSYMHDGSAKVELNGKHGFIDKNGTEYREE